MESSLFPLPTAHLNFDPADPDFGGPYLQVSGAGAVFKERPEIRWHLQDETMNRRVGFLLLTDEGSFAQLDLEHGHQYRLTAHVLGRGPLLKDNPDGECMFFVSAKTEGRQDLDIQWTPISSLAIESRP